MAQNLWQTGAISEHHLQRCVHAYRDYIDPERLRQRITELNGAGKMDGEIAFILNQEGFVAARGCAFKGKNVWLLRTRWGLPTVTINGVGANPMRWPDGSFSIQGVAAEIGITPQTVFHYLARGLLAGHQLAKGQPWQIDLSDDQIAQLRARVRRTRRSKKEASCRLRLAEDRAPLGHAAVRRDKNGAGFVAPADQLSANRSWRTWPT